MQSAQQLSADTVMVLQCDPLRLTHYLTSIDKVKNDLNWKPKFDLFTGLKNSFDNDFKFKKNDYFDSDTDLSLFDS